MNTFRKAADLYNTFGWGKGFYFSDDVGNPVSWMQAKCICLAGTIEYLERTKQITNKEYTEAIYKLRDVVRPKVPGTMADPIVYWNDNVCRSREEARQVLLEAASK